LAKRKLLTKRVDAGVFRFSLTPNFSWVSDESGSGATVETVQASPTRTPTPH